MRVVCISDTHELHRELTVPPGDLLIHAGDFTFFGKGKRAIVDFNAWLGELPHPSKVITCGNHEFALEADPNLRKLITNATLLLNESVIVGPAKIWGSPLTQHYGGAFGRSNAVDRVRAYSSVPSDADIIITHGPPFGLLDLTEEYPGPSGDRELRDAILRVKPVLHVFGHAHGGYGVLRTTNTCFVNAALFDLDGSLNKRPIVLEISRFKQHDGSSPIVA
jgi:predicted phosphohydrolase